jgi:hypothetical protein
MTLRVRSDQLRDFIVDSEGGRFVLTGYGRFGGTSLLKGAMSKARKELRRRGLSEGALLAFYFSVKESHEPTGEFEIAANGFSFGTLTTQHKGVVRDSSLDALKAHAGRAQPLVDTSSSPLM